MLLVIARVLLIGWFVATVSDFASADATTSPPVVVRMDDTGKLLAAPVSLKPGQAVEFQIPESAIAADHLWMALSETNTLEQPGHLFQPTRTFNQAGDTLKLRMTPKGAFFCYTVYKQTRNAIDIEDPEILEEWTRAKNRLQSYKDALIKETGGKAAYEEFSNAEAESVQATVAWAKDSKALSDQISRIEDQVKAYGNMDSPEAVSRVKDLQNLSESLREKLRALASHKSAASGRVDSARQALRKYPQFDEIVDTTAYVQRLDANHLQKEYTAISSGIVFVNRSETTATPIYYEIVRDEKQGPNALVPMGSYPTLSAGDQVYAVVTNWQPGRDKIAFQLKVNGQILKTENPDEVREVLSIGTESAMVIADRKPRLVPSSEAWSQRVLAFPRTARPNEAYEVTIVSIPLAAGGDGKPVTLLDKEKLPQVHPLYRFSVATGLLYPFRKDREFTKVKTVDDDPATTVNEARYRIVSDDRRDGPVPALTIGVYLGRRPDPLVRRDPTSGSPAGRPSAVLGFDLKDIKRNFFGGLSVEPIHNLELVFGVAVGKVHALRVRNEVTEDRDPSPPLTYEAWVGKPFAGVTFNLDFMGKLIEKF